jgi:hypothetical protein
VAVHSRECLQKYVLPFGAYAETIQNGTKNFQRFSVGTVEFPSPQLNKNIRLISCSPKKLYGAPSRLITNYVKHDRSVLHLSYPTDTGAFPGVMRARSVTLITHHLVPRSRMRSYTSSPPWCLHGGSGTALLFTLLVQRFPTGLPR